MVCGFVGMGCRSVHRYISTGLWLCGLLKRFRCFIIKVMIARTLCRPSPAAWWHCEVY